MIAVASQSPRNVDAVRSDRGNVPPSRTRPDDRADVPYIADARFEQWDRSISDAQLDGQIESEWVPPRQPVRSRQVPAQSMPPHLERLCAVALLTHEEEQQWFLRMNYLKHRAHQIRETAAVALGTGRGRKRADDRRAVTWLQMAESIRNYIAHANARLVISLVKQFADARNSFDDLLSEGMACLVRTVEKFDVGRGFRFSTYATRAVRRDLFRMIWRAHRDRNRFAPSSAATLEELTEEQVDDSRAVTRWEGMARLVHQLVTELDDRERFILDARYGFSDVGGKPTFQHLGKLLGVSKERVRQLEQRALDKLREVAVTRRLDDPCELG